MTATITRTRNNLCGSHPPIHFPAEPGMKKNQPFGDMRIPGHIGPVSLVLVCAMRVINGLPPANLICFIINPTKAVWARLGWLECMRVQVAWSGNYPPHGNHHHCLHSVRTQHWSYHLTSHHSSQPALYTLLTVMLGQYSTAAAAPLFSTRFALSQHPDGNFDGLGDFSDETKQILLIVSSAF